MGEARSKRGYQGPPEPLDKFGQASREPLRVAELEDRITDPQEGGELGGEFLGRLCSSQGEHLDQPSQAVLSPTRAEIGREPAGLGLTGPRALQSPAQPDEQFRVAGPAGSMDHETGC